MIQQILKDSIPFSKRLCDNHGIYKNLVHTNMNIVGQ